MRNMNQFAATRPALYVGAIIVCALTVLGCGGKADGPTQVAAKVNKEEISVHQVNYLLQRQGNLKPEQLGAASRQTLDELIDQELVLQAANEQRLDRDPRVMLAVEASRRDIVARAYAERLADSAAAPTAAEVKAYYKSKPELFAERRTYTLLETAVEATPEQQAAVQQQLGAAKNADEVAALLRSAGLRFGTRQLTQGADALPMLAVQPLAGMREGQSYVLTGTLGARVLTLLSAKPAPLSEEEARPVIEQYLLVQRKRQLVEQQVKALRDVARIEYQGKFAQLTPPKSAQQTTAPATPASGSLDASAISKGLSNLK